MLYLTNADERAMRCAAAHIDEWTYLGEGVFRTVYLDTKTQLVHKVGADFCNRHEIERVEYWNQHKDRLPDWLYVPKFCKPVDCSVCEKDEHIVMTYVRGTLLKEYGLFGNLSEEAWRDRMRTLDNLGFNDTHGENIIVMAHNNWGIVDLGN